MQSHIRLVLMTGCVALSSSPWLRGEPRIPFRKGFPSRRASSWKNVASCVAVKPSKNLAISGERRSYTSYPDAHNVSPPVSGRVWILSIA